MKFFVSYIYKTKKINKASFILFLTVRKNKIKNKNFFKLKNYKIRLYFV